MSKQKSKEDLVLDFKEIATNRVLDDSKKFLIELDKSISDSRAFIASALYALDLAIREHNANCTVEGVNVMSVLKKSGDNTDQYEKFFEQFKSAKLSDIINGLRTLQQVADGALIERYGNNKLYEKSSEEIESVSESAE